MPHALVIGEALVDVVVQPDGSTDRHPGGSPANVAVGLGRLGRQVDLLSWVGDDADGRTVRDHLARSGVVLLRGDRLPERTSVATARLSDGAATYTFELDWDLPTTYPGRDEPPLVVHTGSIATVLAPGAQAVLRELDAHRPTSTLCYDPNLRPSILGDPTTARAAVEEVVARCDVVKVSDEDLAWVEPGADPVEVARRWATQGPALVVVTRGGDGAVAVVPSGAAVEVAAPAVDVVDTVGAGDSFMGGLIDGLWSQGLLGAQNRQALHQIDPQVIAAVLTRCARIAAITVSRPGADPPTSAELL